MLLTWLIRAADIIHSNTSVRKRRIFEEQNPIIRKIFFIQGLVNVTQSEVIYTTTRRVGILTKAYNTAIFDAFNPLKQITVCVSLCELNLNELKMSETNRVDGFTLNTHFYF